MKKVQTNYYNLSRTDVVSFVPLNITTILDIGCSQGAFLKLVKEQTGAETWGIELLPEIAEKAKDNADHILVGKIEEILNLIPDNYFDCITFNDVLEHLVEPTEVLKLIKPKLTRKGIVIASIPNVRYIDNLYNLLVKKEWEYKDSGILDSTHLRFFTRKSMSRMFVQAGYKKTEHIGINELKSLKFKLFNLFTLLFFDDTKYFQILFIASKN